MQFGTQSNRAPGRLGDVQAYTTAPPVSMTWAAPRQAGAAKIPESRRSPTLHPPAKHLALLRRARYRKLLRVAHARPAPHREFPLEIKGPPSVHRYGVSGPLQIRSHGPT